MSNPVDLELVKLRCKLRGWECRRIAPPEGPGRAAYYSWQSAVEVQTDIGGFTLFDDGDWGGMAEEYYRLREALTSPRLTLADIIAAPGEGWLVRHHHTYPTSFAWQGEGPTAYPDAQVYFYSGEITIIEVTGRYSGQPLRMLAAHRAVVDLLTKLGEVVQ